MSKRECDGIRWFVEDERLCLEASIAEVDGETHAHHDVIAFAGVFGEDAITIHRRLRSDAIRLRAFNNWALRDPEWWVDQSQMRCNGCGTPITETTRWPGHPKGRGPRCAHAPGCPVPNIERDQEWEK